MTVKMDMKVDDWMPTFEYRVAELDEAQALILTAPHDSLQQIVDLADDVAFMQQHDQELERLTDLVPLVPTVPWSMVVLRAMAQRRERKN